MDRGFGRGREVGEAVVAVRIEDREPRDRLDPPAGAASGDEHDDVGKRRDAA